MFAHAPLLGEVKLVDRPALGQIIGTRCTDDDISRYKAEMDMYASEIASAQQDMKIAVASGNQFMIDAANGKANLANNNWEVRSKALQACQTPLPTKGSEIGPVIALLVAAAVVGSVIVIPKLLK